MLGLSGGVFPTKVITYFCPNVIKVKCGHPSLDECFSLQEVSRIVNIS